MVAHMRQRRGAETRRRQNEESTDERGKRSLLD
jgi:hypothetical protein